MLAELAIVGCTFIAAMTRKSGLYIFLGVFFASPWLQHNASYLALVALIVYIASFAVGLGPVFWLMIAEG